MAERTPLLATRSTLETTILRTIILTIISLTAVTLGACSAPGVLIVERFRVPPRWNNLAGERVALHVEAAHLNTKGSSVYAAPQGLEEFDLLTDVAFTSVASRGLAGIFARDVAAGPDAEDRFYCLALRPTGRFRVFKSHHPLEPMGGSGWRTLEGRAPAGFLRLGMRRRAGKIVFLVDDVTVGEYPVASGTETPGEGHALEIGIFSDGVSCRWTHFLAADLTAGARVDLRDLVDWGDATTGEILLQESRIHLESLLERPSRGRLFALIATFEQGRMAFRQTGLPARERDLVQLLRSEQAAVRRAATQCDAMASYRSALEPILSGEGEGVISAEEERLVKRAERAVSETQLARALVLYASAQELRDDADRSRTIEALLRQLPALGFSFTVDRSGSDDLFAEGAIWGVVREDYGAVPRADDGELELRVVVAGSRYSDREKTKRRVPVRVREAQRLQRLESTVRDLTTQLKEDALDAQARANIAQRAVAGSAPLSPVRAFRVEGKSLTLRVDDGEKLEELERQLEGARQDLARLEENRRLVFHSLDATQITYSFSVEMSCRLALDGRTILDVRREKTYLGLEQWRHEANVALGIEKAIPSRREVEATHGVVVRRALGRLRTAISLDNVVGQLPRNRRLDFLLRLARSSRQDEHRDRLLWAVRSEFEIRGALLERIGDRLLD